MDETKNDRPEKTAEVNRLEAAWALAHDMGALDRCTLHGEYVNTKAAPPQDNFFEEILMMWHERDPELLKLAGGRSQLMLLFEEALCCPGKCPSCVEEK